MIRETLRECELLVRAGQIQQASHKLRSLRILDIPDSERFAVAKLCRRLGLIGTGLRILAPLVKERLSLLNPEEKAKALSEYAVLLQRRSVVGEASNLLQKVDRKFAPEADLYLAFGLFQSWDYEKAKPYLERYIQVQNDPYQKLIGKVNLAAALVNTETDSEALHLLEEISGHATELKAGRLQANSLEMKAEVLIRKNQDTEALEALQKAHEILGTTRLHDQLFVRQWQSYLKARELKSLGPLLSFQIEARERRDWESLRESDFLCLLIDNSFSRREHLYFGSPLSAYRDRICRRLNCQPLLDSPIFGQGDLLDLENGTWNGSALSPKDHQILNVLLKDAYRPVALGTLFSELYPGEFFDPEHSPARVHQKLHRFRESLVDLNIKSELEASRQGYRLHLQEGVALKRAHGLRGVTVSTQRLHLLLKAWPEARSFDRRDLEEHLRIGKTQALKIIEAGLTQGLIQKNEGQGKAQRYLKIKAT